jgi:hypothetical protein
VICFRNSEHWNLTFNCCLFVMFYSYKFQLSCEQASALVYRAIFKFMISNKVTLFPNEFDVIEVGNLLIAHIDHVKLSNISSSTITYKIWTTSSPSTVLLAEAPGKPNYKNNLTLLPIIINILKGLPFLFQ